MNEKKKTKGWKFEKVFSTLIIYLVLSLIFLSVTAVYLYKDKVSEEKYWKQSLEEETSKYDENEDATSVTVGTYIENLREISVKNSYFRVNAEVWFKWKNDDTIDMKENFRIYKGNINEKEIIKDIVTEGMHYQLLRIDVTVTKNYWTPRFPLESHQLRMYIESGYTADKIKFVNDKENSSINKSLSISGYDIKQYDTGIHVQEYDSNHGDPELEGTTAVTYEHLTQIEVNRDGLGLYIKCFIALYGTTLWVLITLCLCVYHNVNPLSLIPPALVGTVSNVMVGANLLPDSLQMGLLEYANIWGVFTILACAISIIQINRIRDKFKDERFASKLGKIMAITIITTTLIGHILLPVVSYLF